VWSIFLKILYALELFFVIHVLLRLLDRTITESFVLMSPSTLIMLKVSSLTSLSMLFNNFFSMETSVTIKASMVAMFGMIMPDPFAIPRIFTGSWLMVPLKADVLIHVSGVKIVSTKRGDQGAV